MTIEPKYNKARLLARPNVECVAVPIDWIFGLLEMHDSLSANSASDMIKMKGYVRSARCFLPLKGIKK